MSRCGFSRAVCLHWDQQKVSNGLKRSVSWFFFKFCSESCLQPTLNPSETFKKIDESLKPCNFIFLLSLYVLQQLNRLHFSNPCLWPHTEFSFCWMVNNSALLPVKWWKGFFSITRWCNHCKPWMPCFFSQKKSGDKVSCWELWL